jgi:hypothetical protein
METDEDPDAFLGCVSGRGPIVRTFLHRVECCPTEKEPGTSMYARWGGAGIYL